MRTLIFVLMAIMFMGCTRSLFKSKWTNEISPTNFVARFETSKGHFDVQIMREWSPKAVDRFYQLLKHNFYDNTIFYRVVPNFVAQFGNSDTTKTVNWGKFKIPDEKVTKSNLKGTISFARSGKETRGNDLFINLENNLHLDSLNYGNVIGFPAFGEVIKGMEVVESIYSGYGEQTMEKLNVLYLDRPQFLNAFPKLDSIRKAYILKDK